MVSKTLGRELDINVARKLENRTWSYQKMKKKKTLLKVEDFKVHHWQHFARTCNEEEKYEETNHVNTIDDNLKVESQAWTASKMLMRKLNIDKHTG